MALIMNESPFTYYTGATCYGWYQTGTDDVIKEYLKNAPYDYSLPEGWEVRFGRRGKFMKYDDVAHVERKNMVVIRETGESVPFGYANSAWETLKSKMESGDELWIWGNSGTAILLVRDNKVIDEKAMWCA